MVDIKTIAIDREKGEQLQEIAVFLGYLHGESPNLKKLIEAIAVGEIELISPARKEELRGIVAQLQSEQKHVAATHLAMLLEIPSNYRFSQILRLIINQVPFRFSYQDAAGFVSQYDCSYGEIKCLEGYEYLYVYYAKRLGKEPDSEELPGLEHNRCFRIDRIPQNALVGAIPDQLEWRGSGLETVKVKFALWGNLARGYSEKPNEVCQWAGGRLIVTRKIFSSFWFLRQIASYGMYAEILEPIELREQAINSLQETLSNYGVKR